MSEEYKEYCMQFSNEELKKYLYDQYCKNTNLRIRCLSADEDEIDITSTTNVETIVFDDKENMFIRFFGYQTSIFVYDVELMFIDEHIKGTYTSSDVCYNVVYEGNLRAMSHAEILQMFSEIILCFIDAVDVSMTQLIAPENRYKKYTYYEPHMFIVNVKNNHITEKTSIYENITIKH